MKILLVWTGEQFFPHEDWHRFQEPDAAKLAWVCADTWTEHGWQVERFRPSVGNSHWSNRLKFSHYPYNNFFPELLDYLELTGEEWIWWVLPDVINFGFSYTEAILRLGAPGINNHLCPHLELQLSVGCIGAQQLMTYLEILAKFDRGEILKDFAYPMGCDETVLRSLSQQNDRLPTFDNVKYHSFIASAVQTDKRHFKLRHYSRSCLTRMPIRRF